MKKTIVLIDGENFQFKLDELFKLKNIDKTILDLKLNSLISHKLKNLGVYPEKIIYYAAKIGLNEETLNKSKELISKQRKLKNKLEKQKIEFRFSGFVRAQKISKQKTVFKEKGVDVGIAVDMIVNAYEKKYNTIILCSSDSDLQPAVREVRRKNCKVIYLGFEHNPNKGLVYTTNRKLLLNIEDFNKYINE